MCAAQCCYDCGVFGACGGSKFCPGTSGPCSAVGCTITCPAGSGGGPAFESNAACVAANCPPPGSNPAVAIDAALPFSARGQSVTSTNLGVWYKFNAAADETITISARFTDASGDIDIVLFRNCGGSTINSCTLITVGATATDNEEIVEVLAASATYYVQVRIVAGTNTFDIGMNKADGGANPSVAPTVALPFATNAAVFGSADEEWFKFSGVTGATVTVTATFIHSTGDVDIYLYKTCSGTTAASCTFLASGTSASDNEQIIFTLTETGVVWLRVNIPLTGNNIADISISSTPPVTTTTAPTVTTSPVSGGGGGGGSSSPCFHEDTLITYAGKEHSLEEIRAHLYQECSIPHIVRTYGVIVTAECGSEEKTLKLTDGHLVYTQRGLQAAADLKPARDTLYADLAESVKCQVVSVTKEQQEHDYFGLNCLNSQVLASGLKASTFEKLHSVPSFWMHVMGRILGIKRASQLGDYIAKMVQQMNLI